MSNIVKRSDGRYDVILDGSTITVQSQNDAAKLGSLPAVYTAFLSGKRNADRIRAVLKVCDEYGYTSHAKRHLESWLSKEAA